jgi:hypothetical protein
MGRTPRVARTDVIEPSDPTIDDDETKALEVGSNWTNSATKKIWLCADSTPGAAVWKDVSTPGAGSHPVTVDSVDPTVGDDSDGGFTVGDHWVNAATNDIFQAADVTVGAAVWRRIGGRLPCIERVIAIDLVVPSGKVCVVHDIEVDDGVTIDVQDDGELLVQ